MKAMLLKKICNLSGCEYPLVFGDIPIPEPDEGEILVRVSACGVCHTELDEIEGRAAPPRFPVVPGHQVIGRVEKIGRYAHRFREGERVGIGWIFSACGKCEFCEKGAENLCPEFQGTGRDVDGGYAEYVKVSEGFACPVPEVFSDSEAAPLLCAGAIGYRSLRLSGISEGQHLGLTGFGASAHLIMKMVRYLFPGTEIYVFARSARERHFAEELGAVWAGDTEEESPEKLHAIIDTTPAWKPVVEAMKNLLPGGRLVINAIRKEDGDKDYLHSLRYPEHLWMEKELKSVANVTRRDIAEFFELAAKIPIRPEIEEYVFKDANRALIELKQGRIRGAKVLLMV